MKLQLLSFAAALPALVAASLPCVDGYDEVGFHGTSSGECCMLDECCLDFRGGAFDELLIHNLYSVRTRTDDLAGVAEGWLYTSNDCTGEGQYLDADGFDDTTDHPAYGSFFGRLL